MPHVMIDIETMGTDPNCPVLSVGAVSFDRENIISGFYAECSMESAFVGASVDASTVSWWMKQADAPRLKLANAKGSHRDMLNNFREWIPSDLSGVWGNGASFDNVILGQAFKREGMKVPWPFWLDRCYRTVKNIFEVPFDRFGDHHNALDDAKSQAIHLISISRMNGGLL